MRVTLTYVVAIAAGLAWLVWGPDSGQLWLDGLIADIVATLVIFTVSRMHGNSSFYDAYWSVLPPLLAFYWWVAADAGVNDTRWWLMMAVLLAWAIRLTANWVRTFPGLHHEDWRYHLIRPCGPVRISRRPHEHSPLSEPRVSRPRVVIVGLGDTGLLSASRMPAEWGFVNVEPTLQVTGFPGVFGVGDVAATDPLRTSARNRGHVLLARNIRAHLAGGPLHDYRPPRRRWGSVLGPQRDGLIVFAPTGRGYRVPARASDIVLQRLITRQGIYGGVRRRARS